MGVNGPWHCMSLASCMRLGMRTFTRFTRFLCFAHFTRFADMRQNIFLLPPPLEKVEMTSLSPNDSCILRQCNIRVDIASGWLDLFSAQLLKVQLYCSLITRVDHSWWCTGYADKSPLPRTNPSRKNSLKPPRRKHH